jgi:hypothetical protein
MELCLPVFDVLLIRANLDVFACLPALQRSMALSVASLRKMFQWLALKLVMFHIVDSTTLCANSYV